MNKKFTGKRVYVSGAGCGIGYEICREFAAEGALVALNSRRAENAVAAAVKINDEIAEIKVSPYGGDISDVAAIQESIRDFAHKNDGLDIFVANAGITVFAPFLEVSVDEFDHLMAVNMRGTYFTVQQAAKEMISRGIRGRIILMSSVCGVQAHLNLSAYAMTKAAIRQLAKSLSQELGDYGITVNVVAPGATLSERTLEDAEYSDGWRSVSPSRTVGTVEDISHVTLFLADERSSHITGEVIMVDGGWSVSSPLPAHLQRELSTP
ncbi:MAG: SDR family oxidoreductase [Lentisphaeraceae bacterium]|nr:SDR family oxidoreductase [Lentisphaeraceae bacterium]